MSKGRKEPGGLADEPTQCVAELVRANDSLRQQLLDKDRQLQTLEHEARRLRNLAVISADWYWEQDASFRFTLMSAESELVTVPRRDLQQALGHCRWERPGVLPLSTSWEEHRAVLEAHQPFRNFEYLETDDVGLPAYFSINGLPVFDTDGKFSGYRGTTRDITQRKRLEAEVGESARFLNDIVENIPLAVHLVAVRDQLRVVGWNKKAAELFGVTPAEALGRTLAELWPGQDGQAAAQADSELLSSGLMQEHPDEPRQTRNRGIIRVHSRRVPLRDATGAVTHILCTTEDITERLESQARLRRNEARYRAVVAALGEAVILRDEEGRVLDCNLSTERILGKTLEQIRGSVFPVREWQLLREDGSMMPVEEHPDVIARRTGKAQSNAVVCYRKPDGTDLWGLINVQPLFEGADKTPSGYVTSLTDISKRKRAELEIVRLNIALENRVMRRTAQLETANLELEAFSYSVAHDLRSPLGTIDGFCALLQKSMPQDSGPKAQHYLERIRGGVRRMGELTNGLLSLAKLSRTSLNWEAVDLSADAARLLREHAEADPARTVEVEVEPALAARGDRALLQQVLQNLIANAWKFTSKKSHARIAIGCQHGIEQPIYFVRDNGAGFDMAYADKLFGTFQRLHSPDEFGGSGIGLATVQRIITRHGGRIWAESAVGEGTTFFFTLGVEQEQAVQGLQSEPDEGTGIPLPPLPRVSRSTDLFGNVTVALPGSGRAISSDNDAFSASDQQFSNAFEHSPIGMALIGLDSRRLRVNSAFCRMLGYSEAEMLSRSVIDVTHPDDAHWDIAQRKRALAGEIETYQWEKRYLHQTGRTVWAFLTCSLVRDADRKPMHFISQVLDITERKQIESTLRESEERFRTLTELSSDWYWEQDENFRFTELSKGPAALGGDGAAGNFLGRTPWELNLLDMGSERWREHRAMHERHEMFKDFELARMAPDGSVAYLTVSGAPKFDASGKFTGYRGVGRDTTPLHRMTEALRHSESQMRQITDTVPALIAYVDAGHHFRFHNRAYEEVFGLSHAQIDGRLLSEVIGQSTYDMLRARIDEVLSGYPVVYERSQKTVRGDIRNYAVNWFPRYGDGDEDGQVIGFYSLATDVTELKRIDRLKTEFISTVRDEVRPPLSGIQQVLMQLCQGQAGQVLSPDLQASADAACADAERLTRLIDRMLDVEKIRASGESAVGKP